MIRITVDLVSVVHASRSRRLGVMHISNVGGYVGKRYANYVAQLIDKRGRAYGKPVTIMRHARLAVSMWQLVAKAVRGLVPVDMLVDETDDGHVVVFSEDLKCTSVKRRTKT